MLTPAGMTGLRLVAIAVVSAACATAGRDAGDPFRGASGTVNWEVVGIHTSLTPDVDTGASKTVLRPTVLRRIGVLPTAEAVEVELVTATGERVRAPLVRPGSLRVGPFSVRNLYVGVYDVVPDLPGIDGLLGLDFLGHFQIRIDRAAGRLVLEPRPE